MKIITAPHQTLRKKAQPIVDVDKKTIDLILELKSSLKSQQNPPGVGLAFPQVDKELRAFAMREVTADADPAEAEIKVLINPEITEHSPNKTLGTDEEEPDMEGCLSIPGVYGPVPRWLWVKVKYHVLHQEKLTSKSKKFIGYPARIVQHELDHLNGILFTDHLLELDLPAYLEEDGGLIEITDTSVLKAY